jgi:hypothetical protein
MKHLNNIMWYFDFYFGWMFYNGYKSHQYHKYMTKRYGDRYRNIHKSDN